MKQSMHRVCTRAIHAGLAKHFRCGTREHFRHRPAPSDVVSLETSSSRSGCARDADISDTRELHLRTHHPLRIAVPASIAHALIAPALPRFLAQSRAMGIHIVIADEVNKLQQCEAAISIQSDGLPACSDARHLAFVPRVLCASEDFLAVHGMPRSPLELNPARCIGILDEDLTPRSWSFRQGSTEVTIVPAAPLMFSDSQSAVMSAVRGGGLILVPALAAEAQIAAGLLTTVLTDWDVQRCSVWMQHTGPLTPQLETFAEFVAGLFPCKSG